MRERAPSAAICFDPFHVVKLVTDALDTVRRQVWQAARTLPDQRIAKAFKGARWALLKNPGGNPIEGLAHPVRAGRELIDAEQVC